MLKPVFTDEMQSAIMQATPDDAGLLSKAIISEFMGLEPVKLPQHLELLMGVFRQQISKLKASYQKKCEDTRKRVERHRNKQLNVLNKHLMSVTRYMRYMRYRVILSILYITIIPKPKTIKDTTYLQKKKTK